MNTFSTARRLGLRLRVLTAIVVVLLGSVQGIGQAVTTSTGASSEPKGIIAVPTRLIKDIGAYWSSQLTARGHPGFDFYYLVVQPDKVTYSTCGLVGDSDVVRRATPAGYCPRNDTVYVSSSWLYNHTSNNGISIYGAGEVIAHEIGHAVQAELRLPSNSVVRHELQADCLAGVWVDYERRIGRAYPQDVQDAQVQVQSSGDYEFSAPDHHGTADQRVYAWKAGLKGGLGACLR